MRILVLVALATICVSLASSPASAGPPGLPTADFQAVTAKARTFPNNYDQDRHYTQVLARTDLSTEQRISVLRYRAVNRANMLNDKKGAIADYEAAIALKPADPANLESLKTLAEYTRGQLAAAEARLADPTSAADFTGRFNDLVSAGRMPDAVKFFRETYETNKQARDSKLGFRSMHYQRLIDSGYLCPTLTKGTGVAWKGSGQDRYANWCEPAPK